MSFRNIIKNIPKVDIDYHGGYKFIVAKIVNRLDHTMKVVIKANKNYKTHKEILAILQDELRRETIATNGGLYAYCIGGGFINVDPEEKKIIISGSSGEFKREPNRKYTVRMLKEAFPKFKIVVKLQPEDPEPDNMR